MSQPSENRLITSARYALCLLTASGVLLSGCASSGVGSVAQTTRAEYYPSCYEPVSHLRSTDNAVRNSAITGAITGGLLGGLAGGLASDE
ncbi:type VI secretion-associated lipoprotein TagQ, partial [Pseudomonas aeruginosa]|nr:type VI secretion-associated lipoprotein TagQ [Pseudomonas aeruginosa]HDP3579970.1 type VI secretion system-associated lipoprotein TagQ [Pseudomonas aeruginosa]